MDKEGRVIAAVCHGPAAFVNVKSASGKHLLKGHIVTGQNPGSSQLTATNVINLLKK